MTETDTPAEPAAPRRRLRTVLGIFSTLLVLAILATAGTALWLNGSLANLQPVEVTLPEEDRPDDDPGSGLNILLLGGEAPDPTDRSILEAAASETWPTDRYRSDATIMLHITEDREEVFFVSIPRQAEVVLHDETGQRREKGPISDALSRFGPSASIATVEQLSDVRIDLLAMVDWDGFTAITDALGGVEMTLPESGRVQLTGDEALDYVRRPAARPDGGFDRVSREQAFLRALLEQTLSRETLTNPFALKATLDAATSNLAVDDEWSDGDLRSLAFSLRGIRQSDLTFVVLPTRGTRPSGDNRRTALVDPQGTAAMFDAMRTDTMRDWVDDSVGASASGS